MGMFNGHRKKSFDNKVSSSFTGIEPLYSDSIGINEKFKLLLTDVETEGKKQGYAIAAKEYMAAYKKIESEFKKTKEIIENRKDTYESQAYQYIERLEELERQKDALQKRIEAKTEVVSQKYNIPKDKIITNASITGVVLSNMASLFPLLDIVYLGKLKKLITARQCGYEEAKKLYEAKISKLNDELQKLKEKGNNEIATLVNQISQILTEISENERQIIELEMLL